MWKITILFEAPEAMAREMRDTFSAMGVNTRRNGFKQQSVTLTKHESQADPPRMED